MYELISSCTRCGNPIYVCKLQHTQNSSSSSSNNKIVEILPQVLRTCECKFATDEESTKKSLEILASLETMFRTFVSLLQKDNALQKAKAVTDKKKLLTD